MSLTHPADMQADLFQLQVDSNNEDMLWQKYEQGSISLTMNSDTSSNISALLHIISLGVGRIFPPIKMSKILVSVMRIRAEWNQEIGFCHVVIIEESLDIECSVDLKTG